MQHLMRMYTLVLVRREGEVLLGWKKKGFGADKWNGFGGKIEPGETVVEAAVRELKEESELITREEDLQNIGHLEFTIEGIDKHMEVRVFTTTEYSGVPRETEEMRPQWFKLEEVPFPKMWPDDPYWFPYMLDNKPFVGKFHYKDLTDIISYELQEVESMEKYYQNKVNKLT